MPPPTSIALIGATGFVGRHLVHLLAPRRDVALRLLVHRSLPDEFSGAENVRSVRGDVLDPESLGRFIQPRDIVVNLAYLARATYAENLQAAEYLAHACRDAGASRLVHCSTAVVVGDTEATVVDENTACQPMTPYESAKLAVERVLLDQRTADFEVIVLRPTAVFGAGGRNLIKLADAVRSGGRLANFVRRSLYGKRRMNAVAVENVVAALRFLIETPLDLNGEVLIVSDDEYSANNYADIEHFIRQRLSGKQSLVPAFPLPQFVLRGLLRLTRRSCANPDRVYDGSKLLRAGFVKPVTFDQSLAQFADWYRKQVA